MVASSSAAHASTTSPPTTRAQVGLGRSFQEARLFPALTVEETIAVALERHLYSRDFVAAGLRLPASTLSEWRVAERVEQLIEQLGLGRYAESLVGRAVDRHPPHRRAGLRARAGPAVLLLDEPTGGVAQKETEALGPLLRQVREETSCSMLVIEHDMPLLSGLCDRLVALELGRVIAEGRPAEVLEHPRVDRVLPRHRRGRDEPLRRARLAGDREGGRAAAATQESLTVELPMRELGVVIDRVEHRRGHQQPVRPGLGQLRQPGRLVDRIADDRVLEPLLRANVARDHETGRDADRGRQAVDVGQAVTQQPRREKRAGC